MKTFVQFSNENKLTDKQSELCFDAWNTACENKNNEIQKLQERILSLEQWEGMYGIIADREVLHLKEIKSLKQQLSQQMLKKVED